MLNSKQKQNLRSLGNTLKATVQIGKEGIKDSVVESLDLALEAHELVKVSVLKSFTAPVMECALDLSRLSHCEIVQVIGRSILLYRPSKHPKINL